LDEERFVDRPGDGGLLPGLQLARIAEQPVRVQGVRLELDEVEAEVHALGGTDRPDVLEGCVGPREVAEGAREVVPPADPGRLTGRQLEGAVEDVEQDSLCRQLGTGAP
jgi:hypothetical protein